jgi:hypothetical protein
MLNSGGTEMYTKIIRTALLGLALIPAAAHAQQLDARNDNPEIRVADGKVTMSVQSLPLGRLLELWDRVMGQQSQILKTELAGHTISVHFENLGVKDAVQTIFEGQSLNYMLTSKGIRVVDVAQPATPYVEILATESAPAPEPVVYDAVVLPPQDLPSLSDAERDSQSSADEPVSVTAHNMNTGFQVFSPIKVAETDDSTNPSTIPANTDSEEESSVTPEPQRNVPGMVSVTPGVMR